MANSVITAVKAALENTSKSFNARRADVIKLVGEVEGARLCNEWLRSHPQTSCVAGLNIGNYTFGIELEVINCRRNLILAETRNNGLQAQYEGYNHTDNTRYYKFVSDSSISGTDPVECVSPILNAQTAGFGSVKAICKSLNDAGANVNRSTGYHVHVGGDITDTQYVNTFVNYQMLQGIINLTLARSRRSCHWCANYTGIDLSECNTPNDVLYKLHNDRYWAVNPCAWSRHRTIEFRQHQGTINASKVLNWAKFCIKLVAWSRNNRLASPITSIDEIPFLTATEKRYFKARIEELNPTSAMAV